MTSRDWRSESARSSLSIFLERSTASLSSVVLTAQPIAIPPLTQTRSFQKRKTWNTLHRQTDRQTDRNGFKWIELGKNSVNRPFKHGSPKQPGKAANHSRKTTKKNDQRRKPGSEIATQTNVELKQTQEIEPLRAFNPEIRPFKYDKNQEMRNSTSAYLVCLHRVILACSPRPATALDQTGSEEESPNRLEICANINYAVNTTSSQPEMVLTGKYGSAQ